MFYENSHALLQPRKLETFCWEFNKNGVTCVKISMLQWIAGERGSSFQIGEKDDVPATTPVAL